MVQDKCLLYYPTILGNMLIVVVGSSLVLVGSYLVLVGSYLVLVGSYLVLVGSYLVLVGSYLVVMLFGCAVPTTTYTSKENSLYCSHLLWHCC